MYLKNFFLVFLSVHLYDMYSVLNNSLDLKVEDVLMHICTTLFYFQIYFWRQRNKFLNMLCSILPTFLSRNIPIFSWYWLVFYQWERIWWWWCWVSWNPNLSSLHHIRLTCNQERNLMIESELGKLIKNKAIQGQFWLSHLVLHDHKTRNFLHL